MKKLTKDDYIKYRLEKAEEAINAADVLSDKKLWNSMVNRLYYACFYAIIALLLRNDISTKSHAGVKTQFFLKFAKTGKVPKELGKLYSDLFDSRLKGDYNDFYDFEEKSALQLFKKSVVLINKINELMELKN